MAIRIAPFPNTPYQAMVSVIARLYPEIYAGGFSRKAGGLLFYARVQELITPEMTLLDFGAGRGLHSDSAIRLMRELSNFQGKAAKVIGVDLDEAVLRNPRLDEAHIFDGRRIPLPDQSVDLILADHVFEHIDCPRTIVAELDRVLRPGGWICARTPSAVSLIAIGARLFPNRLHAVALRRIQPHGGRRDEDVFPTRYRLNSMSALRRHFPKTKWLHYSYYWDGEPAYHFGSVVVAHIMRVVMAIKPGGEKIFVFLRKKNEMHVQDDTSRRSNANVCS